MSTTSTGTQHTATGSVPRRTSASRRVSAGATGRRRVLGLAGLSAALLLAAAASVAFGARDVGLGEIWAGLTQSVPDSIGAVAVHARIPRTVLAVVVGAALGLAGALMQAVTRNPLADPGILGVNTGAALAVVLGIAFLGIRTLPQYVLVALVGATAAAVAVYAIGSAGRGGPTPISLALAGAAMSAALSSLVMAVLLPHAEVMTVFRFWSVGGVGGATWPQVGTVVAFLLVGGAVAALVAPRLDVLALGDDVAVGLGVPVARTRLVAAAAGVALCAASTAVAGPIGFVGLMVPHAVRGLTGPDQRWVLALSALGGAVLLMVGDTLGRVLGRPGEIEAGIVTAFLGAPALVWIARRARMVAL